MVPCEKIRRMTLERGALGIVASCQYTDICFHLHATVWVAVCWSPFLFKPFRAGHSQPLVNLIYFVLQSFFFFPGLYIYIFFSDCSPTLIWYHFRLNCKCQPLIWVRGAVRAGSLVRNLHPTRHQNRQILIISDSSVCGVTLPCLPPQLVLGQK